VTPGIVSAMWRHPVKGFTPEPVNEAILCEGQFFPFDRLYALEVGHVGFDPENPKTISKMKFAVLARWSAVARLRTRYDEVNGYLDVTDEDGKSWRFDLSQPAGRHALARHVETMLGRHEDYDPAAWPLNVLEAPEETTFRFTDSRKGFVSFLNLNSLRDLSQRIGAELDPLRMRANVWVEDWSAFEDHAWVGHRIHAADDGPVFEVLKPIERCVATHVNPNTAERDIELCTALWQAYGHRDCGIYARIVRSGTLRPGDQLHVSKA